MLIKSLLTTDNQFNSTEELIQWIQQRNRDVKVSVEAIPFKNMEGWYQDAEGSLRHNSGRFFSIQGINVQTDYGQVNDPLLISLKWAIWVSLPKSLMEFFTF